MCEQRLLSKNWKIWLLDNVTSVYLASTTSSSSGPFIECKRHSTHSQTAVSHQANTHCVHWNIQVTATISTSNTTTGALHLQTLERLPDFLTWGGDVENVTDMLILCIGPKIGQHWKTLCRHENYCNDNVCCLSVVIDAFYFEGKSHHPQLLEHNMWCSEKQHWIRQHMKKRTKYRSEENDQNKN